MSFERRSLYGCDFGWFGIDANDSIALFISGYGKIPNAIFSDTRESYDSNVSFLYNLHEKLSCASYLTEERQHEQDLGRADYIDYLELASNGFFVYQDNDEIYELVSYPGKLAKLSDLPKEAIRELMKVKFHNVQFNSTSTIDVEDFFESV